jgi:hypothetical protein
MNRGIEASRLDHVGSATQIAYAIHCVLPPLMLPMLSPMQSGKVRREAAAEGMIDATVNPIESSIRGRNECFAPHDQ